jgi:organic radical activating enzyme
MVSHQISMKNKLYTLPFVHVLITQTCNMSCLGCCTISDQTWPGYVSWQEGQQWLTQWQSRIQFERFGLVGGEPFINPELDKWILGVRQMFPDSRIQITTNGSLLHKHYDILELLDQVGNSILKISRHIKDDNCDQAIDWLLGRFDWTQIREYGLNRLVTNNGFRLDVRDLPSGRPYMQKNLFIKTYDGPHHQMRPYNNNAQAAYAACLENGLPVLNLHQGRLYKCMTMALRQTELDKFGRPNYNLWQPLLAEHPGANWLCTDEELDNLFANIGQPAGFCRQCPTKEQEHTFFDHSRTVFWKRDIKGKQHENQTHQ